MPPRSRRVLPGKRYPLNMRTTKELRDKIEEAAMASGRSLVQEVEFRLETSFQQQEIEKETDTVKLQVRLSERLRRRVEQAAKHHDWSMNTEIVDRLDVSFQRENQADMLDVVINETLAQPEKFREEVLKLIAEHKHKQLPKPPGGGPNLLTDFPSTTTDKEEKSK
jgi:predicted HicB family RNase H-like nuclease